MAHLEVLLKRAFAYIPEYGFTRRTLALSNVNAPSDTPLSDTAVTALFGSGNEAPKTLIRAWMLEGRANMVGRLSVPELSTSPESVAKSVPPFGDLSMEEVLMRRLEWNEPVLHHLKDAFALLAVPATPFIPFLDVRPCVEHALDIANDACYVVPPVENGPSNWYTRRMGIAGIYTAAELHQLATEDTSPEFLGTLLSSSLKTSEIFNDLGSFADFGKRGWEGIMKGRGIPL